MSTWFEAEPSIFQQERSLLEGLGFVLDQASLDREKVVRFIGRSRQDPDRALTVEFPSGYPSVAPEVYDDGARPLLVRHHHPQNRAFCLFGPNRQNWISTLTSEDAVKQVEELIRDFSPGSSPAMEQQVPEPVSDLLPTDSFGGILIPPELATGLEQSQAVATCGTCQVAVASNPKNNTTRGVLLNAALGDGHWTAAPLYTGLLHREKAMTRNAVLVRLDRCPPAITRGGGPSAWLDLVPKQHRAKGKQIEEWFLFVYPEESGKALELGLAYTMLRLTPTGFNCLRCFPLTPRHTFARIPGLEPLADKDVVILGVGALGSRIAVGLAASGLRKAFLLDRDAYEPVNAVRHAAGFTFFGLPKVAVVRDLMVQANPLCLPFVVGQIGRAGSLPVKEDEELQERIRAADLVIDATASEHAAHWVGRICHRQGKPHLHATVTNGAWGGDVIRVIPGRDACWVCQQVAHDPPATQPKPPGGFFAPGCAHPTFTGNAAEVGVLADLATAMAIETLLGRPERDFQGSHIRWSARSTAGAWAPTIEVVAPRARPECTLCPPHLKSSATPSSPTTPLEASA